MIIHDYQCENCKAITEHYVSADNIPDHTLCPSCNFKAVKIFRPSQTSPVDASWIGSVLEVVDKDSDAPHCKEFLKHPSRANYTAWMKGENLRPLEHGERVVPESNKSQRREEIKTGMLKKYRERNAVSI